MNRTPRVNHICHAEIGLESIHPAILSVSVFLLVATVYYIFNRSNSLGKVRTEMNDLGISLGV